MKNAAFLTLILLACAGIRQPIHAQTRDWNDQHEWLKPLPGEPDWQGNCITYKTTNYLAMVFNHFADRGNIHLFDGKDWKVLHFDSITNNFNDILFLTEHNDSFYVVTNSDLNTKSNVYLFDGTVWKRIDRLCGLAGKGSYREGITQLIMYKHKLYGIFLDSTMESHLFEYDMKTDVMKNVVAFQQLGLNNPYRQVLKFSLSVRNNRLYVAGAYDLADGKTAQGYGYYDGNAFVRLNLFSDGCLAYTIERPLDSNRNLLIRFPTVLSNNAKGGRIYLSRNDSIIDHISGDFFKRSHTSLGLAYYNHQLLSAYERNGSIQVVTMFNNNWIYEPESNRWYATGENFFDGMAFFFKNERYIFGGNYTLPYQPGGKGRFRISKGTSLSGTAYFDLDNNCTLSSGDSLMRNTMMTISGSGIFGSLTDRNGRYAFPVEAGQYRFVHRRPDIYSATACGHDTLTVDSFTSYKRDIGFRFVSPYASKPDAEVTLSGSRLRRGGNYTAYIRLSNLGRPDITVTPSLRFPPQLSYVSSSLPLRKQGTNRMVFDSVRLGHFAPRDIHVSFYLHPDSAETGDVLFLTATVDSLYSEVSQSNNIAPYREPVVGPYDPNAITGNPEDSVRYSPEGIVYTVEFENLGNDTAFNVSITDTLAEGLDIGSLRILDHSGKTVSTRISGRVIRFMLPDIRLTPKTVSAERNKGYICFSLALSDTLAFRQSLGNRASIYFDYEAAVITNTSTLVRTETPVSVKETGVYKNDFSVYPNPAGDRFSVIATGSQSFQELKVYSASGQLMVSGTVSEIDCSGWSAGVYLLLVRSGDHWTQLRVCKY